MQKLKVSLVLAVITLLLTACQNNKLENSMNSEMIVEAAESGSDTVAKGSKAKSESTIEIPINITSNGENKVKILNIEKDLNLEDKLKKIVDAISSECFNSLPMSVELLRAYDVAKVYLTEPDNAEESRVTWSKDYLSEGRKEETINTIVTNLIQDEYSGEWVDKVRIFYNDEAIQLD